jgi:hypothetical protein
MNKNFDAMSPKWPNRLLLCLRRSSQPYSAVNACPRGLWTDFAAASLMARTGSGALRTSSSVHSWTQASNRSAGTTSLTSP